MDDDISSKNQFVRFWTIVFLVLLVGLIITSFLCSASSYSISPGIITLLGISIILVLAESFHTLSFGRILTLSRHIKETEREKSELRKDNTDLRNSLINFATNLHQSQITTNISGADLSLLRQALGVVPATQADIEEEETEPQETLKPSGPVEVSEKEHKKEWRTRQHIVSELEELLIGKFIVKYNLSSLDLQRDVQFGVGIESVDPIMDRRIVYDGYVKTPQKEYFIEVRSDSGLFHPMWADRMYVMLAKLFFYRQAKKTEAELVLLSPSLPEQVEDIRDKSRGVRVMEWLQPAISNGLLRVETFSVSKDEYDLIAAKAKKSVE